MNTLHDILNEIPVQRIVGNAQRPFQQLVFDSRQVKKDDLFIAITGYTVDGHQFIEKAIAAGAAGIICEKLPDNLHPEICYVEVADSAETLGLLSAAFYDYPSQKVKLVGITGTNGKTSTTTLLYNLFTTMGYKVGLISTVENKIGAVVKPADFTTPDAIGLNVLLAEMVEKGCDYVFMEVSSHAIHQRRIAGLTFAGGVFTNLTHDHLDYHKTFKAYSYVKKRFFDELPKEAFALTNIDDRQGAVMVQNTKAHIFRYSLRRLTDFKAKVLDNSLIGLHLKLDEEDFFSRLIGDFNAYNLLAVYATARLLGAEKMETLTAMSQLQTAEGRFDYVVDTKRNVYGIVDYAHTPDALEKVLETLRKLRRNKEQIITVVGCGGDRDRQKRPIMARMASVLSDQVILTSDNPRTENPDEIIAEMEAGIPAEHAAKVLSISNREQAIRTANKLARPGDFILVAGKGHEKYQEINGVRHPFDDKALLNKIFTG